MAPLNHRSLLTILLLVTLQLSPHLAHSADTSVFLATHCYDCHSGSESEGDLDLSAMEGRLESDAVVDQWTQIYERVERREMPPPDASQPPHDETQAWLSQVKSRLMLADRARREVVHRRLNRQEYEYTVHDLLQIDIPLKPLLPEDQIAGGFSNNGAALAVSTEQLEAYFAAARTAVDAAIVTSPRPETHTLTADSVAEVTPYLGKQYEHVDERIVAYMSSRTPYSKISSRSKSKEITAGGRYRIRFHAAVHNSTEPQTFLVDADGVTRYFEAHAEPQEFSFMEILPAGGVVQFHPVDLPDWVKDPVSSKATGVGFGPVTITGPLHDTWPPASHQALLGDVDIDAATIHDAELVLRRFLPRAFRRPVTEAELGRYVHLVQSRLDAGRSFDNALRVSLTTALCSVNFLYQRETQLAAGEFIDDFELATRLSYFLWSSMPDERLTQLASQHQLHQPQTLTLEVDRMLTDPKSERFVHCFTDHWLQLRRINETTPDQKLYPEFDDYLQHSMLAESRGFFRKLIDDDLSVDRFLDADFAMLNRRLARHYGVPGVEGAEVHPVKLPADSVRGGVLTQAAVLKVTANGTNTSPVQRGVWALENILGRRIPPPPPDVSAIEPDIRGAETVREQLVKHRSFGSCQVCHQHIDPPGFALESFDPIGRYREHYIRFQVNPEHVDKGWGRLVEGAPVDASGTLPSGESFQDIRQFKQRLLAHREQFARCLTEKLFIYGLGRELGFSDRPELERITGSVVNSQAGLRSLIHRVVQSPTFRQK